ncbi:MAG: PAS domain S-box protein [Desulfovermiculus sp.]
MTSAQGDAHTRSGQAGMRKLRWVVLALAVQAFIFASAGGYLVYVSLRHAAIQESKRQCVTNVEMVKRSLDSMLSEYMKPVQALAHMEELSRALTATNQDSLQAANAILDTFQTSLQADVCYLLDASGMTLASSNRYAQNSFVGKGFGFRPYFQKAIAGNPYAYMALGVVSGKRGVYYSAPVMDSPGDSPVGVAVIKASIGPIESRLLTGSSQLFLVHSPEGIVFITNHRPWLFTSLQQVTAGQSKALQESRQFGSGPWQWSGLRLDSSKAQDRQGTSYLVYRRSLEGFPGWGLVYLHDQQAIAQSVQHSLIRITGPFVFAICVVIGISVFLLYRTASKEILRRNHLEDELRESESKYRSIYHKTPAMLHSIDEQYRLVSVSDYWLEITGYTREEVIGRKLTDFFTPESKQLAEDIILPRFFKRGLSKEVPYKFIKRNGQIMDILLSCLGIWDEDGCIARTLAISVDVTARNRAQEELKKAKEKLSKYSRGLEKLVHQRSQEMSGILKYTPAVIYIKNRQGEYQLINDRFEKLFHVSKEDIVGKRDEDRLPAAVASQLRSNDLQVLKTETECQFTEWVRQADGLHTYLSVKFPIYGQDQSVVGVCGISTDITELQKAQDKLRRLSARVMENQERERAALSRELHDELGQMLTALRMDSVWLEKRLPETDEKAARRASIMRDLVDKTIDDVRHMAYQLRPGVLDDLGLIDALDSLVQDFRGRSDWSCTFETDQIPEVESPTATAVYRIVQEGLTNALRHARASQVKVSLTCTDNQNLVVKICDDGVGFDVRAEEHNQGFGLTGMQERAHLVGGSLSFSAQPGQGTTIVCRVALGAFQEM